MTKPSNSELSEHVLKDMMKQMKAAEPAPADRAIRLHGRRDTCMVTTIVFGWFFLVYPFWLFNKEDGLGLFGARWGSSKNYDFTVKLGLFGVDVIPYKKPANLDNVKIA